MHALLRAQPGINAFHRQRSKCLDAFAELERVILQILGAEGLPLKNDSFGQKLKRIRNAAAASSLTEAQLSNFHSHMDECEGLAEFRNDIVHSTLQLKTIGGSPRALFINTLGLGTALQSER